MQDTKDAPVAVIDEWYYWQDEAGKFMRSPRVPFDDELRGKCSGIPACCIKFYVEVWSPNDNPFKDCPEHSTLMDEAKLKGFKFSYVPCPSCLESRNFVELKHCTSDGNCFCGQWERRELMKEQDEARKQRRRSRMARKKRRGYA